MVNEVSGMHTKAKLDLQNIIYITKHKINSNPIYELNDLLWALANKLLYVLLEYLMYILSVYLYLYIYKDM